jgi:hypothetical protein
LVVDTSLQLVNNSCEVLRLWLQHFDFVNIFSLSVDAKFGVNVTIDINECFNISLNIEIKLTLRDGTCDGIVVLLQYEWLSHFEHIPCYMSLCDF